MIKSHSLNPCGPQRLKITFELPVQVLAISLDFAVFGFARFVGCFAIVRRTPSSKSRRSPGPSSSYCAILLDLCELTEHDADLAFSKHSALISAAACYLLLEFRISLD